MLFKVETDLKRIQAIKGHITQEMNAKEKTLIEKSHAWTQQLSEWLELMNKDGKIASYKCLDAPDTIRNTDMPAYGDPYPIQ